MARIRLKYLLTEELGPFFSQDPKNGYARPKLTKADHSLIQSYINYALGRYKKDLLKPGTKLSVSRLYELIRKSYREKGESVEINTSKLERWFNGHDILKDSIPLLFNFETKEIEVVKLEDGIAKEKEKQQKEAPAATAGI